MRIAYADAGGGGRGGYSAGNRYGLWKQGIIPSEIYGISVGALNGLLVALGQYNLMRDIWHEVEDDDVRKEPGSVRYGFKFAFHKIGIGRPQIGYWMNQPLKDLVRKNIINKRVQVNYSCGVVNVRTGKFEIFRIPRWTMISSNNVDKIVDMVVASTAIPVVFQPVIINNQMYVDGGVKHVMPLKSIVHNHVDDIDYIIGISHGYEPPEPEENMVRDDLDMLKWTIDTMQAQCVKLDFKLFKAINEMCRLGATEFEGKPVKYYPNTIFAPEQELSPGTRFHHKFGKKDFEHGFEQSQNFSL